MAHLKKSFGDEQKNPLTYKDVSDFFPHAGLLVDVVPLDRAKHFQTVQDVFGGPAFDTMKLFVAAYDFINYVKQN